MIANHSRNRLYIAGGPGGGSLGPPVHEHIAQSLGLDWTCEFLRLSNIDEVMKLFRAPDFAGGIVTMPHKRTIMPLLDRYDELVQILGACNFVYLAPNGQLQGTNTDWVGIYEAILARSPDHMPGRAAMVYGAGGASRAAIYALWAKLKCSRIYIVNRDDQEVAELLEDVYQNVQLYRPEIVHVRSVSEAKELEQPYYIVSTVPDFEAISTQEIEARSILIEFLSRKSGAKGILLDMCYHPRTTRNLKLAAQFDWKLIEGFTVSACQFPLQWKLWTSQPIDESSVFAMVETLVEEREKMALSIQA